MLIELLFSLVIPLGLDLYMPVPDDNPLTRDNIALGNRLFFDTRLSRDGSTACATCHDPARAFSDGRAVAAGIGGRTGARNTPALVNRGYGRAFFWDARVRTLEEQVLKPIEAENEMGFSVGDAAARVGVTRQELSRALASFVRSILSGNSPFDRYVHGDLAALTDEQRAGLDVFRGKGNCVACHVGPNFSDELPHNTGVAWRGGALADAGAGGGDFKTPTLREVERTAPYMHDGSIRTLEDVVDFYDAGGRANPFLDTEIRPLGLTRLEKRQLASFLRALTGKLQFGAPDTQTTQSSHTRRTRSM